MGFVYAEKRIFALSNLLKIIIYLSIKFKRIMKTIKFFGMLFAAAALSFTATSCGEDKDIDDIIDDIEQGNIKPTASLKKSSDELVFTVKFPGAYTEVTTAKFRNGQLASLTRVSTYSSKKLADAAWEEIQKEGNIETGVQAKRDGKTITWDLTEAMSEMSYEEMLKMFEELKYSIDHATID